MWVGVCSSLNMVAFAKIMKKYNKLGRHRFGPLYNREVEHSYFATSDKVLEDISQAVGRTSWPPIERILFDCFWCIDGTAKANAAMWRPLRNFFVRYDKHIHPPTFQKHHKSLYLHQFELQMLHDLQKSV